jgi:hypothetical protein
VNRGATRGGLYSRLTVLLPYSFFEKLCFAACHRQVRPTRVKVTDARVGSPYTPSEERRVFLRIKR